MKWHLLFEDAKHKDIKSRPRCIWCHSNRYDLKIILTWYDKFWTGRFSEKIFWVKKIDFYKATFSLNTSINGLSPHVWGVPDEKYSSVFHLPYVHYDGTKVLFKKNNRWNSSNDSWCCHGNQGKHSLNFSRDYLIVLQEGAGITSGRPYGWNDKIHFLILKNLWRQNRTLGQGDPWYTR